MLKVPVRAALATAAAFTALVAIPPQAATAAAPVTVPLREAVAALPVADEDRTGYDREESFGGWIDADRDSCNTRQEVLLDEAVDAPTVGTRCALSGGRWWSYYDEVYVDGPRSLDIDHMVPLAESWDSGASSWSQERRVRYANDLTDPRHLVAVTGRSNRSKADRDPAQWLPPAEAAHCRYVTEWTSVKARYGLTVDTAEKAALTTVAAGCPNEPITYTPAQ
jgi:hypothetical protein